MGSLGLLFVMGTVGAVGGGGNVVPLLFSGAPVVLLFIEAGTELDADEEEEEGCDEETGEA